MPQKSYIREAARKRSLEPLAVIEEHDRTGTNTFRNTGLPRAYP